MCMNGNCGGCNSCNECNECSGQYSSNCKPILDVNCLPTLGRTSRHYIYRTPDSKLWYANANCTAWLELTKDGEQEASQTNLILDLTNKVMEFEKALNGKKEDKETPENPSEETKPEDDKYNTLSEALETLKTEVKTKAGTDTLEAIQKAVESLTEANKALEKRVAKLEPKEHTDE